MIPETTFLSSGLLFLTQQYRYLLKVTVLSQNQMKRCLGPHLRLKDFGRIRIPELNHCRNTLWR